VATGAGAASGIAVRSAGGVLLRDFQTAGLRWGVMAGRHGHRRLQGCAGAADPEQQALGARAFSAQDVVAIGGVEDAVKTVFRAHLQFKRRVRPVVYEEQATVRAERPAWHGERGIGGVHAHQGQALVRVDRAYGLPDRAVARGGHRVLHLFARRGQVDGVAELDLHFARRDALVARNKIAHFIATEQVAEILLVQRGQRLRQVAHARAAGQVTVVVDVVLRQHQRHVREAAGGGAAAQFARRTFEQIAQQRAAREQRQTGRLPQRVGVEHVFYLAQDFVLDIDRHD
jgi:hypothetical protein